VGALCKPMLPLPPLLSCLDVPANLGSPWGGQGRRCILGPGLKGVRLFKREAAAGRGF
jgi:hypothetical protein